MTRRSPSDADVARDMAQTGNVSSACDYQYEIIDPGAGPRSLPTWLADANIRWNFGWSSRPELELCFHSNPLAGVRYRKGIDSGEAWFGNNPSGDCFETHWHGGMPVPAQFTRKIGGTWDMSKPQLLDGKPWIDTTGLWPDQIPNAKPKMGGIEHETYTMLATSQQDGYAGRHIDIVMADDSLLYAGETIRLRGPWHGGTGRADTVAVVGVVWDDAAKARWSKPTHWTRATKCFGYNILERTFIDALATFFPHCPIARVTSGPDRSGKTRTWIEPCLPQTQAPRFMTPDQQVESRRAAA